MIVILGVLLMVLMANLVAMKIGRLSLVLYAPLIVSVLFLYLVPQAIVVNMPLVFRALYSVLIIPLPIFSPDSFFP